MSERLSAVGQRTQVQRVLLARLAAMRADRDRLAAHLADVEARLAAVEALHREGEARLCKYDLLLWPCPTIRALHPAPTEGEA